MTVAEIRELLNQYPPDWTIEIQDGWTNFTCGIETVTAKGQHVFVVAGPESEG